ncbi:uncharacterized protein LOC114305791 [Camellia sinensis]|uniref:uncharacterized protein LOC114305791 n=1 Tax=Camellia sinensis TaxID=4442 RepID=UPI0010357479|nr:uncharacterized protein LOC114305791 [Camellia sinensis]
MLLFKRTNFNPLSKIIDDNRLTGSNYVDWKRNLTIVLTAEKLNYVLATDPPVLPEVDATDEQREAVRKWHEADDVAKCYILVSMTNVLQKQHKGVPTAKDMMINLKEMFGEQSRSARQTAMKGLMSTKIVEDIDGETKIDAILSSLPDSYNQFILNYNMNKMIVAPSELLNMLQAAEDLIKKSQPTVMMGEKEGPRKFKPKGKNNFNKKPMGSKYGYLYLMKHNSKSFEKFKEFRDEVERQLGKNIKALRSDRGGEYLLDDF